MGNTISDVLYPDNPNRRARAGQLKDDIENFCRQFNDIKASRDSTLKELGTRLSKFLKSQGYNSPEELDAQVRDILKDESLGEYIKIYKKHNEFSAIERAMFQISSVVAVVSGVFLGALCAVGAIAAATLVTCLEVVGAAVAILGVVAVILAAIQGAQERADLQDAIRKMAFKRVEVCQALKQMEAISNWLESIRDWLDNPKLMNNPERLRKKLEGDFRNDFAEAERARVVQYLVKLDTERESWTNEDPDWRSDPGPTGKSFMAAADHGGPQLSVSYLVGGKEMGLSISLEQSANSVTSDISRLQQDVEQLAKSVHSEDVEVNCVSLSRSHVVRIAAPRVCLPMSI